MNSLALRNAGLSIIVYLLCIVFSGIYENQFNQIPERTADLSRNELRGAQNRLQSAQTNSTQQQHANAKNRTPTAEEIQEIMMTRKLPYWAKGSETKTLSLEEIEEVLSSGKLPDQ